MSRKTVSGPLRNKDRTKNKLIKTVGKIIQTKGFHELKITKIAKAAGVDKKLIYEYFGTTENLINEYLRTQDFGSKWKDISPTASDLQDHGKQISKNFLDGMLDELLTNKELRKIIVWELYEYNDILRKLSDGREEAGEKLFAATMQPYFKENHKKFRAVLAILISSTYYLNLHAESNGSNFVGLRIHNDEQDQQHIRAVIKDIIDFAYEKYKP